MESEFALIHSPLVGPASWAPVASELRRRGRNVVVPKLRDDDESAASYWQQEVDSVVSDLDLTTGDGPLVLVGHSGAGTLLPLIGERMRRPLAGLIYVDAGLPLGDGSRLAEIAISSPDIAVQLRAELALGNRAPNWTDDDLQSDIPDDHLRLQVLSELQPRSRAFYEEPIPSPTDWEHMSSGYLLFSPFYFAAAENARQLGWPVFELSGSHFHLLIDPSAVAAVLLLIANSWE
ncbi:MAG TPA: alpha/beta fold hydrolase [Nitrolancea sp.]|jgi:pimeloyl-ACP methyl ester carboxylesterase|nr:alpha/beta fold hydrolase [Nitrolancea sp.]